MLRIIRGIQLRWLLLLFYGVVFVLAALADSDFLSVAFDSGGVTTGPMTVPFILALGVGVSNIRSDRKAEADSFGLVALCSIGPILAVLVLGFFYSAAPETVVETSVLSFADTAAIGRAYLTGHSRLSEGNGRGAFAGGADLPDLSGVFSLRLNRRILPQDLRRYSVHVCGAGAVPDRGQRGLFLPGHGAGRGAGQRLDLLLADPAGHAAGLVHHLCRTGGLRAGKADRRGQRGHDPRQGHQAEPFHRHCHRHGAVPCCGC